jgi:hypothetical protein
VPYFLVPQLACIALLFATWQADLLKRPAVTTSAVALGITVQWFAPMYSPLWVAALLFNVATGIALAIRMKLG